MNVVKRQVEALRGSMEIETELGGGTTFRLLLPLSLALTQALLVKIGKETYAVPLHHIERTIEIEPERIQTLHRWKILRRENEALPIFRLSKLLGTPELGLVKGNGLVGKQALVVRRGNQHLGLIVDDLLDKQEIVVKPLPKSLTGISGLSGTTIVGTGQVIMILDIPNLVQGLV